MILSLLDSLLVPEFALKNLCNLQIVDITDYPNHFGLSRQQLSDSLKLPVINENRKP